MSESTSSSSGLCVSCSTLHRQIQALEAEAANVRKRPEPKTAEPLSKEPKTVKDMQSIVDALDGRLLGEIVVLKAQLAAVQPYLQHTPDCDAWLREITVNDEGVEGERCGSCTCGLSRLIGGQDQP